MFQRKPLETILIPINALPASYSSTSDILNVDTFSLSTEAQGALLWMGRKWNDT